MESKITRKACIYLTGISRDVRDHFKAICAKRGSNMTKEFDKFMRKTIREEGRNLKDNPWAYSWGDEETSSPTP